MSTFEFVSVLFSIVVSLAVAHLLTGVAQLIRAKTVRFGWVHAGWWLFVLLLCVDFWFSLWQKRDLDIWSFGFVLFQLWQCAVLYVAAWLVVPEVDTDGAADMQTFHDANRRRYLTAVAIWVLGGMISNGVTPSMQLANLIPPVVLALLAVAWVWKHRLIQIAVIALILALFAYYAVTFIPWL